MVTQTLAPTHATPCDRSAIDSAATVWAVLTESLELPLSPEQRARGERAMSALRRRLARLGLSEDDLIAHLRKIHESGNHPAARLPGRQQHLRPVPEDHHATQP